MLSNVMPLSIRVKSQSFIGVGGGGGEGKRAKGREGNQKMLSNIMYCLRSWRHI